MALPGFHKFFKHSSDEEREHAEKLMKYQNKRGGRIVLQDIKVYNMMYNVHFLFNYSLFLKWKLSLKINDFIMNRRTWNIHKNNLIIS